MTPTYNCFCAYMYARSFEVPASTMHEALEAVVMKPLQEKLTTILWTFDDIKELQNNQVEEIKELKKKLAEKEEKGATKMDAFGVLLVGMS